MSSYYQDLHEFMRQAQEITAQVREASAGVAGREVTGSCEGGAVQVTMTSAGDVRAVRIRPAVLAPDNVRALERQVAEAVQDALARVRGVAEQALGPLTENLQLLASQYEKD